MTRVLLALPLLVLAAPASANEECRGITCSGHGQCFEERGVASCLCDAGYVAVGTACAPGGDEEAVMRARRDPTAGLRVRDIAMNEVGRRRHQIGADLGRPPHELSQYLMPEEWWCADFVSWIYAAAGVPLSGGSAGGWLIPNNFAIAAWFEARDLWIDRDSPRWADYNPRPGDFIRIHTDLGGHAAIVHHVSGDTLYAVEGNVYGRVELERHYHWRSNHRIHGFGVFALPNGLPTITAGRDFVARWPSGASLMGVIADDGPDDALSVEWSQRSGPGDVAFQDAHALETLCTFSEPGDYVLRLEVSDGEHSVFDEVAVEAGTNSAPVVRAWIASQDGMSATVRGAASDTDELEHRWSKVSGPGRASFEAHWREETEVTFSEPGVYVLRFTADDGELSAEHEVTVEAVEPALGCSAAPTESAPFAFAAIAAALTLRTVRARRARSRR